MIINVYIIIYIKQFTASAITLLPHCRTAPGRPGPAVIKAPRSHSDTPHWVAFLWTGGQSDADNAT